MSSLPTKLDDFFDDAETLKYVTEDERAALAQLENKIGTILASATTDEEKSDALDQAGLLEARLEILKGQIAKNWLEGSSGAALEKDVRLLLLKGVQVNINQYMGEAEERLQTRGVKRGVPDDKEAFSHTMAHSVAQTQREKSLEKKIRRPTSQKDTFLDESDRMDAVEEGVAAVAGPSVVEPSKVAVKKQRKIKKDMKKGVTTRIKKELKKENKLLKKEEGSGAGAEVSMEGEDPNQFFFDLTNEDGTSENPIVLGDDEEEEKFKPGEAPGAGAKGKATRSEESIRKRTDEKEGIIRSSEKKAQSEAAKQKGRRAAKLEQKRKEGAVTRSQTKEGRIAANEALEQLVDGAVADTAAQAMQEVARAQKDAADAQRRAAEEKRAQQLLEHQRELELQQHRGVLQKKEEEALDTTAQQAAAVTPAPAEALAAQEGAIQAEPSAVRVEDPEGKPIVRGEMEVEGQPDDAPQQPPAPSQAAGEDVVGGETGGDGADGRDDLLSPDESKTLLREEFQWRVDDDKFFTKESRGKIGYGQGSEANVQPIQPFGTQLKAPPDESKGESVFKQKDSRFEPFRGQHEIVNQEPGKPADAGAGDEEIMATAQTPFAKIGGQIIWIPFYAKAVKMYFTAADFEDLVSNVTESRGKLKLKAPDPRVISTMQKTVDDVRSSLKPFEVFPLKVRHETLTTRYAEWLELRQIMKAVAKYQKSTSGMYNQSGLFSGNLREAVSKAIDEAVGMIGKKQKRTLGRGLEGAGPTQGADAGEGSPAQFQAFNPFQVNEPALKKSRTTLPRFF